MQIQWHKSNHNICLEARQRHPVVMKQIFHVQSKYATAVQKRFTDINIIIMFECNFYLIYYI